MLENNKARLYYKFCDNDRINYLYTLVKVENGVVKIEQIKERLDWRYSIYNTVTNKTFSYPIKKYIDVLARFTNYGDNGDYYHSSFSGCYINKNGTLRITYFEIVGYEDGWYHRCKTYPALLLQHCIYKLS